MERWWLFLLEVVIVIGFGRILLRLGEGRVVVLIMNGNFKGRGRDRGYLRGENFRGKVSDVGRDFSFS